MKQPQDFKACVHCRHFKVAEGGARECHSIAASLGVSLVTAKPQWARAEAMRAKGNKLCGPDGRLFALPATPIRDAATAFYMGLDWRLGRAWALPGAAGHSMALRWRKARAAWRAVADNTNQQEAPAAKDGQPTEPLPAPDQPKPEGETPKPGDLPQTEGALIVHPTANGQGQGGTTAGQTAAPHMALAVAVLLLGFIMAGVIGQDHARATVAPTLGCQANGKATCCYRMPDGSTRCFDCSTKA